jgi:hypothetical protein
MFENFNFLSNNIDDDLMIILVIKICAFILSSRIRRIRKPHLEYGFRMQIQETKMMRMRMCIRNTGYIGLLQTEVKVYLIVAGVPRIFRCTL